MANFAVAASQETIEKSHKVMELYAQDGDKKEDTLRRIMEAAENEAVRGTHPELEPALRAVDSTVCTLIKQINGIIAGQDAQMNTLKKKLEAALEDKAKIVAQSLEKQEEAQKKMEEAEVAIKEAAHEVRKAIEERDQSIIDRDEAKALAAEKSKSNDFLMKQLTSMEASVNEYRALQKSHDELRLSSAIAIADAKMAQEKAVMDKEREIRMEYEEKIREADRKIARLEAMVETQKSRIVEIEKRAE